MQKHEISPILIPHVVLLFPENPQSLPKCQTFQRTLTDGVAKVLTGGEEGPPRLETPPWWRAHFHTTQHGNKHPIAFFKVIK